MEKSKKPKKAIQVDVKMENYLMIEEYAKKQNASIRQLVNDLLYWNIQKKKFTEVYFPNLQLYSIGEYSLFIKDHSSHTPTTVEISLNEDGKISCSLDDKNDEKMKPYYVKENCQHVRYALCLPQVYILLNKARGGLDELYKFMLLEKSSEEVSDLYEGSRVKTPPSPYFDEYIRHLKPAEDKYSKTFLALFKEFIKQQKIKEEREQEQQHQQTTTTTAATAAEKK